MLRILGWAPHSSGKMVLRFILGNEYNFCFSRSLTLVSRYLGISVNKLGSQQFPVSKFVTEEGLGWWGRQLTLNFPPRVVLGCGLLVGLPRRQGCRQLPLPGRPASSPARVTVTGPSGCVNGPIPACPPHGFPAPRVSPAQRLCLPPAGLETGAGRLLALLDTVDQRLPLGHLMGFWALFSFCSHPGHCIARS